MREKGPGLRSRQSEFSLAAQEGFREYRFTQACCVRTSSTDRQRMSSRARRTVLKLMWGPGRAWRTRSSGVIPNWSRATGSAPYRSRVEAMVTELISAATCRAVRRLSIEAQPRLEEKYVGLIHKHSIIHYGSYRNMT